MAAVAATRVDFATVSTVINTAVADDAMFGVSYPAGTSQSSFFSGDGHYAVLNNNDKLANADPGFAVSFDALLITITNRSGYTWPAGTRVMLQFALRAAATLDPITATRDPVATDDVKAGYSRNSVWLNTTSNVFFRCADPQEGFATWTSIKGPRAHIINAITTRNFYLLHGNGGVTDYPVPTFTPTGGNRTIAFDLIPSGNPVETENGFSWIDVCHNGINPITARVGITSAGAVFGSRAYGTSSPLPTFIDANGVNGLKINLDGSVEAQSTFKKKSYTVATLPAAATAGAGAEAFVTDANATMTAGIGATVAGGGANKVPVYSDGTAWKIG